METLGQFQRKTTSGEAIRIIKGEEVRFDFFEEERGKKIAFREWSLHELFDGVWPNLTAQDTFILLVTPSETHPDMLNGVFFDETGFAEKYTPVIQGVQAHLEVKLSELPEPTNEQVIAQLETLGDLGFSEALLALETDRKVILESTGVVVGPITDKEGLPRLLHVLYPDGVALDQQSVPVEWILDKTWKILPKEVTEVHDAHAADTEYTP